MLSFSLLLRMIYGSTKKPPLLILPNVFIIMVCLHCFNPNWVFYWWSHKWYFPPNSNRYTLILVNFFNIIVHLSYFTLPVILFDKVIRICIDLNNLFKPDLDIIWGLFSLADFFSALFRTTVDWEWRLVGHDASTLDGGCRLNMTAEISHQRCVY